MWPFVVSAWKLGAVLPRRRGAGRSWEDMMVEARCARSGIDLVKQRTQWKPLREVLLRDVDDKAMAGV